MFLWDVQETLRSSFIPQIILQQPSLPRIKDTLRLQRKATAAFKDIISCPKYGAFVHYKSVFIKSG